MVLYSDGIEYPSYWRVWLAELDKSVSMIGWLVDGLIWGVESMLSTPVECEGDAWIKRSAPGHMRRGCTVSWHMETGLWKKSPKHSCTFCRIQFLDCPFVCIYVSLVEKILKSADQATLCEHLSRQFPSRARAPEREGVSCSNHIGETWESHFPKYVSTTFTTVGLIVWSQSDVLQSTWINKPAMLGNHPYDGLVECSVYCAYEIHYRLPSSLDYFLYPYRERFFQCLFN